MPDPPEVAFADGDELTMSVMFGWTPTGAGCVFVWALCHLVRSLGEIARRRAARAGQPFFGFVAPFCAPRLLVGQGMPSGLAS